MAGMENKKLPMVYPDMRAAFVLIVICFAAWGTAANMTDPLVKVFSKIFTMSTFQSALVQFSYYGAYFCLALPAAFINKRFSYRVGVLVGLGCAATGAFLFYPASQTMTYGYFLAALFVLAGGLSILETSANPFIMSMGPEANATRRLNLAQAFNPVGTNLGVFLAATLILPKLNVAGAEERAVMDEVQLNAVIADELNAVMLPYVGMACALVVLWIAIAMVKAPTSHETVAPAGKMHFGQTLRRLLGNRHYRFGVVAQFFYVAAQTCVWTFTIQYVIEAIGGSEVKGGVILQYSMIAFLIARFAMTWVMGFVRPSLLLAAMAGLSVALCVVMAGGPGLVGVAALVAISACMSLMFPTIYGIALHGLGDDTKFGAAGLVMAILGGALMPMVQGAVIDARGAAVSYLVPAACFVVVTLYAVFDLRSKSRSVVAEG